MCEVVKSAYFHVEYLQSVSRMQFMSAENKVQHIVLRNCYRKDYIYYSCTCATFLSLGDVRPVAADCFQTDPFHSALLTQHPSITKPLRSAFCGCSMTIFISKWQGNIMQKTNVHISGILPWIMWLISTPNWFRWSFFLLWKNQTGLVCAGQQNKEMLEPLNSVTHHITISFGCNFSHPGLISGGPWQMRGERKAGWKSALVIFPLSLLTDTKALPVAWRRDFCSQRSFVFFTAFYQCKLQRDIQSMKANTAISWYFQIKHSKSPLTLGRLLVKWGAFLPLWAYFMLFTAGEY